MRAFVQRARSLCSMGLWGNRTYSSSCMPGGFITWPVSGIIRVLFLVVLVTVDRRRADRVDRVDWMDLAQD